MQLPSTPSARPRRAPRRSWGAPGAGERRRFSSLRAGGAYGTGGAETLTGRASLRDEPPGRRRWDEPPYEPEAEALTGRASLRYGALITGGAYGTSLLTGRRLTGRASLRTEALSGPLRDESEPLYRPELRASIRDGPLPRDPGGLRRRYGTSLLAGPTAFTGRPITGRNCFLTDRRRLQNEPPYGPETLTGRATGWRRLRDEPPYRTQVLGRASLPLHNGGTDGTDEPPYGPER